MGMAMAGPMMSGGGPAGPAAPGQAPPPPPPPVAWHIAENGQTVGPFTPQQLAGAVAGGRVHPDTPVWTAGMAGWLAANQVPQLQGMFAALPPPPPPPARS
jgi:hypothetical protein